MTRPVAEGSMVQWQQLKDTIALHVFLCLDNQEERKEYDVHRFWQKTNVFLQLPPFPRTTSCSRSLSSLSICLSYVELRARTSAFVMPPLVVLLHPAAANGPMTIWFKTPILRIHRILEIVACVCCHNLCCLGSHSKPFTLSQAPLEV